MPKNYVSIQGQHLNKYSYGSGGSMTGGYYRETVKQYNNRALITVESSEWHYQDPTVEEYLTDREVLNELEAVIRKYKMNYWNRKTFTKMFVNDAASEYYSFDFDNEAISFSSQIYPEKYRDKLAALDSIVKKYIDLGEKLPGLVNPAKENEAPYSVPEGELSIYVYSYAQDMLGLKVSNGTSETIELSERYKLINADTKEILVEEASSYNRKFSPHSRGEMDIRLKERLGAGNYKIVLGEVEISFEIR